MPYRVLVYDAGFLSLVVKLSTAANCSHPKAQSTKQNEKHINFNFMLYQLAILFSNGLKKTGKYE